MTFRESRPTGSNSITHKKNVTLVWPWPMNYDLDIVRVRAKLHQAHCSGSWVIALTEHDAENNTAIASMW